MATSRLGELVFFYMIMGTARDGRRSWKALDVGGTMRVMILGRVIDDTRCLWTWMIYIPRGYTYLQRDGTAYFVLVLFGASQGSLLG